MLSLDVRPIESYMPQICVQSFVGSMQPYGVYVGAGGLSRYVRVEYLEESAPSSSATGRFDVIFAHLSPTRAQLADALGVSRQRVYQMLGGENPGPETTEKLRRLTQLATQWQKRHARPLGMILPKPTVEMSALWAELAKAAPEHAVVERLLGELDSKHRAFEAKESRRSTFRTANPEPGLAGLLPPKGYWAS